MKFPIDATNTSPPRSKLSSEDKNAFIGLLGKFVVSSIEARGSQPCFY